MINHVHEAVRIKVRSTVSESVTRAAARALRGVAYAMDVGCRGAICRVASEEVLSALSRGRLGHLPAGRCRSPDAVGWARNQAIVVTPAA